MSGEEKLNEFLQAVDDWINCKNILPPKGPSKKFKSEDNKVEPMVAATNNTGGLQEELDRYKSAFSAIAGICKELRAGNLETRIIGWQDHGDLPETLCDLNYILDITDAYVREAGASLSSADKGEFYRVFLESSISSILFLY